MRNLLRTLLAVVAGIGVVLVLVIAVEFLSSMVHPMPPGTTGTMEETCLHVSKYPHRVLGVVVGLWSATGFVGTWTATRIGQITAGVIVALLVVWAVSFNLWMLPYTRWFKVVMPICIVIACLWGVRRGMTVVVKPD